jgi:tetratricopeptide (TPR) repeat protein
VHAERLLWNMRVALEELAGEVERGEPEWACRTGFARWLYYQARYDDALAVVGGVLEARPGEPRALLVKGDVLARQGRHAEALEIGRALAGRDPLLDDDAWQLVADACQELGLWSEAEAALAVRLELAAAEGGRVHRLLIQRAELRIHSGDLAGAARDLDAIASDRPYVLRRVAELRARIEAAVGAAADPETAQSTADAP